MNSHALEVLEYREALARVAGFASSPLGAEAVRSLEPRLQGGWVRSELELVSEMEALVTGDEGWAMPAVPDLREPLQRLGVPGSVWEAVALRDAGTLVVSSRTARRSLIARPERFPRLAGVAEFLADLPGIAEDIGRAIDEDGEVRDGASPELARIRREIKGTRSRIVDRLTSFASSLPAHFRVPDASVSIREGRYVVPVRREGLGEVGGIVHGESGTGATLFVEPPVAIEMMNRLRELESAEAREVLRILRELTDLVRPHRDSLLESLDRLVRLDSLFARGRYALRVGGVAPEIVLDDDTEYEVVQGRHPLLLAASDDVVPFDLRMDPGERTLLISGPNTGGKTVLLKTVGLLSLLTQSGIVPPVGKGTRLPIFRQMFADIGDEQSIEASLSTFSAHLKNLRETLELADAGSLVLIDEIGSGTDPVEGGALAQAILLELTHRSAFTVATTHLGQLKLLPTEDAAVVNASLQFDAERLQPTYRLIKGLPGRSYGLAIARRLGLPTNVLERAELALPEGERDVSRLLLEIEAKEQQLSHATIEVERRLAENSALGEDLERRERQLRERERQADESAREHARELLLESRQEVEAAIREVRSAADGDRLDQAARAARQRVERAAREQRPAPRHAPASRGRSGAAGRLEIGLRVRIESIASTGTVLELRDGKATVEAGGIRLQLPAEDLTPLPAGDQQPQRKRTHVPSGGGYIDADMDASSEVDLRGLRVDEMEGKLARSLDAALVSGLPSFRIIHGKGTGALRARVQEILKLDRRLSSFRPGERYEGGTGVTVVEF
ncbi:MAG TPA: endonuclease MutS2 [Longimicrobiaceae bacterium]|nr:endonuclease MutS2 [Longimicrobiaceae bacterium]